MKIFRLITCLFMLMFAGAGAQAATKIASVITPLAYSGVTTQIHYYIEVLTPEGVSYGVYKQTTPMLKVGSLQEISWVGPGSAPTLKIEYIASAAKSQCTGLDDYDARARTSQWECDDMTLGVYSDEPVHGCPWLVSTYTDSVILMDGIAPYVAPKVHNSSCPVSVATYDISWSEDYISYTKVLSLQSTGGMIEKTLPTYLMESGKLCDGSQMDDRGAYCRFVSQMITFTTSGCDSSSVTVTPNRHPITDKQLHDMVVQVDTSSRQPIDSTCRFQYTLNEL
ncbi:StfH/YfcO family fimbrial adhesin [Escherichia albertii]|nr:StfH/YfcO family fimbrial adhesin [Escherichia albertii]